MFIYGEYNLFSMNSAKTNMDDTIKRFCKNENIDFYYLKNLINNCKNDKNQLK